MSDYTIERFYPVVGWSANPEAIFRAALQAFRDDAALEAAQHGYDIDCVANVTGYLEDRDGQPATTAPARIRFVAVWVHPPTPTTD